MSIKLPASSIALIYAVIAALWIVLSSTLVTLASDDPVLQGRIELFKGLAFVAVTSLLLYALLLRARRPPAEGAGNDERTRNLPLVIVLALVVPLVGFAVYVLHSGRDEQDFLDDLAASARLKSIQIESWLAERRADAEGLAASRGFIEHVAQFQRGGESSQRALVVNRLQSLLRNYGFGAIQVLDSAGQPLLALGDKHSMPEMTRALVAAAVSNTAIRQDEFERDAAGRLHLDWVVPLVDAQNPKNGRRAPVAILVLHVSPEHFLFPMIQLWPSSSESGEFFLVRREGDSVVFLNELRHRTGAALSMRFPLTRTDSPAAAAVLANRPGTLKGVDYRGVPVLAAWRPVAGTDWHLIAKIDRHEALAAARSVALWVSAIAALAVLVVAMAMVLLWRARLRVDQLNARVEADRLFKLFYDLPFAGMAITSPASKRWVRFNDHLCEILGYPREELAEKSWTEMTHVEDLAKDVAEFDRVMRGESEGYTAEKRFIRKDGAIVHVEIDAKCARKPDGTVDYFVTTVQDITGRKQAEAHLVEQLEELNRWNKAMLGREERILELKQEVNELAASLGEAPRYRAPQAGE